MLLMIVSDGEVYKHHAKLETLKEYHYSVRDSVYRETNGIKVK